MHCECRTDSRTLVVVAPDLDAYPELATFGSGRDWTVHDSLGALEIRVGADFEWSGIAEAANFLRAVLDPRRFGELRGAWVQNGVPVEKQLPKLIQARPLAEMVPVDSSALMGILDGGRLETWFQPVFRSQGLELWGFECLMRGRDAAGGLVGAPALLEWARQEHLTFMLDRVSRETHLRNAGAAGMPAHCSFLVNFLPTAIYKPEFCLATTVRAAAESGLDPSRVIFEVVETERVPDRGHLRSILAFYRERGFRIALDDVGSGFAGLSLLGDLRPDLIKIDRELVEKALGSPIHREICASLVRIGHDSGLLVLAEGVETEMEWKLMEELGANLFQGYLFGRPSPQPVHSAAIAA